MRSLFLNIFCHFPAFPRSITAPYNGIVMWNSWSSFSESFSNMYHMVGNKLHFEVITELLKILSVVVLLFTWKVAAG